MPRELHFLPDHRCYLVRWRGDMTPADTRQHWRDLLDDPRHESGLAALHDLRDCRLLRDFSGAKEEQGAYRKLADGFGMARVAMLVGSPLQYGMARQLMTLLDFDDLALVTYDEADAKAWIGLAADYPLPYEAQ